MKKLLVLVLAVALNACVAPNEESIPVVSYEDYSISVDEALRNLESELRLIDGSETRSNEPSNIKRFIATSDGAEIVTDIIQMDYLIRLRNCRPV